MITRKNKKIHKISKRVLQMWKDPTSVWGKNKPLEKFWQGLASGKYVVIIYKNGNYKLDKKKISYNEIDVNTEIEAVLTSNFSQDAYEVYLYPKAKDKSVNYVINNYKKYFKSMKPIKEMPFHKKIKVPS
jgi:hypothetical protein